MPEAPARLHAAVFRWYRRHRRLLAWRATDDPYEILVSEIMLQQTQVARVQEKLPLFLSRFPNVRSLARARRADVVRAWAGMGYNNRAVRLHELARTVVARHGGRIPDFLDDLLALPGIGPYTAHAVLCFAHRRQTEVVDVNIHRLLSRLYFRTRDHAELRPAKEIWGLAAAILPGRDAYTWNQALMDLGAAHCTARTPACPDCPLASLCASRSSLRTAPAHKRSTPPRSEPRYDGIPRRIWRGRIVGHLRTARAPVGLRELGRRLIAGTRAGKDTTWIASLVRALERDGIARIEERDGELYALLA